MHFVLLVINEGKTSLLLYKQIIQRYLSSLLWLKLATYFATRATPINDIDGKGHKTDLKSSKTYSTNHIKSNSHLWPQGVPTHTYIPAFQETSVGRPAHAWFKN